MHLDAQQYLVLRVIALAQGRAIPWEVEHLAALPHLAAAGLVHCHNSSYELTDAGQEALFKLLADELKPT